MYQIGINIFYKFYIYLGLARILGSLTSENLLYVVRSKLAEFGIVFESHIFFIMGDKCSVNLKMFKNSGKYFMNCLVHGIHNAVVKGLCKKNME